MSERFSTTKPVAPAEPLCSICQSELRFRPFWVRIGTHKDCLDKELEKVNLMVTPKGEKTDG